MLIKEVKKVEQAVVTQVKCDMCDSSVESATENAIPEFGTLSANWGYGSKRDGECVEYHLCESCFQRLELYIEQERRINTLFDD